MKVERIVSGQTLMNSLGMGQSSTGTNLSHSYDGYYLVQMNQESTLVKVENGDVPALSTTVREMKDVGYQFVPMAVMPVKTYKENLQAEYERGLKQGSNQAALKKGTPKR